MVLVALVGLSLAAVVSTPAHPADRDWPTDPDYNSLMFVPTSETLEKGDAYYRNFELLFNNVGYALTDYMNLSAMVSFPVTADFTIFSIGTKVRVLSREQSPVGFALAGSATFGDEVSFQNYSAIASVGNKRYSFTAVGNLGVGENDSEAFYLLGGDVQIATRVKLLAEIGNSATALDDDFNGVLNAGVRAFWDKVSFTLTAFRPLEDGLDNLIAVPFASFSAHF